MLEGSLTVDVSVVAVAVTKNNFYEWTIDEILLEGVNEEQIVVVLYRRYYFYLNHYD